MLIALLGAIRHKKEIGIKKISANPENPCTYLSTGSKVLSLLAAKMANVAAALTGRTKKPTNTNFLVGVGVGELQELQEGIDFLAGD